MALAKTTYLANALLNGVLRNTAYTPPATVYLALFTSDPGDAGTQTSEITGGDYARVAISFAAPSGGISVSDANVDFAAASGDWNGGAPIDYCGVCDASTAGNVLYHGPLTTAVTAVTGTELSFAAGSISVQET